jgi:hypothetical protein
MRAGADPGADGAAIAGQAGPAALVYPTRASGLGGELARLPTLSETPTR